MVVNHVWGQTVIPHDPQRIVSLSFNGLDHWLALGIQPVAYRVWYGGDARGLWPWAVPVADHLDAIPLRGEIQAEQVARLKPHLIDAMYSGLTHAQYKALSRIAPVLPPPPGASDFGASWQQMTHTFAMAVGQPELGLKVTGDLQDRFAEIRNAHPDWAGKTAVIAWPDGPLIYGPEDARMKILEGLGLRLPQAAQAFAHDGFYFRLDKELTAPLDADVLVWLDLGGGVSAAQNYPLRHTLNAVAEGREVVTDPTLSAAMSYASPLSIAYALDRLVPLLEQALDGNPATPVDGVQEAGLSR
ncbi:MULTISPECIES: ABC transporter substrate-binding protein [Roseobacteraceae]|uniref:ABC transporter substrate-binding protein n=1 Tax=Roseobacteraceae TaxID=2854170 RepID=UPI0012FD16B9|nr:MULTISPECIES: ABC transporter substrate-binding protein [Roseobacteraceae]